MQTFLLYPLLAAASAADLHSGVVMTGHADFAPPRHQSAREGVSLDFPGGIARVYVGPTVPAAQEWFSEKAGKVARQKPIPLAGLGEEALHAEDAMVLVRDGNIAMLVQVASGARAATEALLGAVDDSGAPWPAPASLVRDGAGFRIHAPQAVHVAWVGGRLSPSGTGAHFHTPPRQVVTWGPLGRATVQAFDEAGEPIQSAPPRPRPARDSPPG
ncbi:MAG: hypothetical protein VX265_01350 [Myxococcota bacterium]|nr:hypothetical protein [Myxococcota bacterium]